MSRGTTTSPVVARDQIAPRDIYCITRDVHDDRSIAQAVCEGRFTHAGVVCDLGTEPDWLGADLPSDEEWRIEWNKFYYGLDLANAFSQTDDLRFLHAWESLVRSWIDQVPIGYDSCDVAARRMQNWIYAWSLFGSSPSFPGLEEGLSRDILESIAGHVRYVRRWLTPQVFRNHRTFELYSLFVAALAFPAIDPGSELLNFTISELRRTLAEGFRSDGVHRESSTHYHLVALRSLLGARENARRFSLELPNNFDFLLERACEFALHCHRPDGVVSALSDSDGGSYPEVLELAASLLDRPDFRYAATAGARGTPSVHRYASFSEAGYYFQRSGWGTGGTPYSDERFLVFDCGPLGEGGHGHYDLLSVEVYAHGRPLIVDPGRYTYSEDGPNLRHWFKGTAAHNTVCVDGLDQTPYRRGRPGKLTATGSLLGRHSEPGLDLLEGQAESPSYDAIHTRRILFVADEYWIVDDELSATDGHRYDLRWHLSPEAWGATELLTIDRLPVVRAPGLALVFASNPSVEIEPGWVSPSYGSKDPAPVVSASTIGSDARLITLIAPVREEGHIPHAHLMQGSSPGSAILELAGVGPGREDRDFVGWGPDPGRMRLGSLDCIAKAAWLRESRAGATKSFLGLDHEKVLSTGDRS